MSKLHRTQIYLEEEQLRRLRLEAVRERLASSELIRRAIDDFLKNKENIIDWENDPLNKAVGKIKLDVTDAAERHDHYLYGRRKKP